ncbi:MAG: GHKL domain-containing protein [Christensenellales bacterium]
MSIIDILGQIAPSLMMCLLIINMFQLRLNKKKTVIIFFVCEMAYYFATYYISHLVLLKILISIIVISILLLFLSIGQMKKRIVSIVVFFVVIFSAEAIAILILSPLVHVDPSLLYPNVLNDIRLIMVSVFSNIFIIEVIIVSAIYKDIRKDIKIIIIGLMLFVFIPQIIFILSMLALVKNAIVQNSIWFILVHSVITLAANIIVYILIEKLVRIKKDEAELSSLKEQSKLHYDYYRFVMEKARETAGLRHEISNQLQTAYALFTDSQAPKDDALRLLNGIDEKLSEVKRVNYCNKPIVNAILSTKTAMARDKGIDTDILISDINNTSITDMDICSLFCNLYDNAIEACEKIDDVKKRFIRIRSTEKADHIMIQFANSHQEAFTSDSAKFITSKRNKRDHGYGLKLIRGIVNKYDGNLSIVVNGQYFEAALLLKL